jgi:hypothetical protein
MNTCNMTSTRIINCIFIILSAFFIRCSDGMDVLMQPDKSYIAFLYGNIGSANLSDLRPSSGTLTPAFNPDIVTYTSIIDVTVSSITVTPVAQDHDAIILVNGVQVASGHPSGSIDMDPGENLITVDVTTNDDMLTKSYYITVVRCDADNANLVGLALSSGTLAPAFASGTFPYTAYVDTGVASVTVTPTAAEELANIRVNGTMVLSGQPSPDIALDPGVNIITVDVLSYDGSVTRTYTVTVIKCDPDNADLSNLTLSTGTLSPVFASAQTSYTSNIHLTVGSITVTPTAVDPYATITVQATTVNSGQPSGSLAMVNGPNTITVVVTSPDGSVTKPYSVVVTRQDMTATTLSSLVVSSATLNPGFTSGQTSYTSTIDTAVTAVTVTPTATSGLATITVNGSPVASGTPSGSITMNHGVNSPITVVVTNGAESQTYTVSITRVDEDNANLSGIALSNGALSPAFSESTTSYTTSVTTGSITVTPTAAESYASITVNGVDVVSGQPSASIPMNIGNNTITIAVTSYDDITTRTYTIIANRSTILTADFVSTKSIRLDTTSSGAGVNGTVTNFPVLIRLTDAAIIDAVRPDADDIRFLGSDGTTWLNYEVERWDQANNLAEVWVLVPTVTGNSYTNITLYYNDVANDSIPNGQNAAAVFSTANGFAGVWHMNENPTGGSGAIKDRTANANNGTATGMASGDQSAGQIAGSINFDGSAGINLGTGVSLQPGNVSIEFWMKRTTSWASFTRYTLLCAKSSSGGNGWYIDIYPGIAGMLFQEPFNFFVDGSGNGFGVPGSLLNWDNLIPVEWIHMVITFNTTSNSCVMYKNGATLGIETKGSPNTITSNSSVTKRIGSGLNSDYNGMMDEVRISSVVRSADWVKLEYENQKTGQSLVKFP